MIRFRATACACLLLMNCYAVFAGQFSVSPVTLEIQPGAKAGTLKISNEDIAEVSVQIRVFRWHQETGSDELVPTESVIASPPVTYLPPGGEQLIRVVNTDKSSPSTEQTFRLLIDELPVQKGARPDAQGEINVLLRYSVPVFFLPNEKVIRAEPVWTASLKDNELQLTVENRGNRRLRIANMRFAGRQGSPMAPFGTGLVGYVLPGSVRTWSAEIDPHSFLIEENKLRLWASTDTGEISELVPLAPHRD